MEKILKEDPDIFTGCWDIICRLIFHTVFGRKGRITMPYMYSRGGSLLGSRKTKKMKKLVDIKISLIRLNLETTANLATRGNVFQSDAFEYFFF